MQDQTEKATKHISRINKEELLCTACAPHIQMMKYGFAFY